MKSIQTSVEISIYLSVFKINKTKENWLLLNKVIKDKESKVLKLLYLKLLSLEKLNITKNQINLGFHYSSYLSKYHSMKRKRLKIFA